MLTLVSSQVRRIDHTDHMMAIGHDLGAAGWLKCHVPGLRGFAVSVLEA